MSKNISAIVLGATGYVGGELLRLIASHPNLEFAAAVSESKAGSSIAATFPHLSGAYGDAEFVSHEDWPSCIENGANLALFSAAPHGASAALIRAAIEQAASKNINLHIVDSSADFRYAEQEAFEAVYGVSHGAPELLSRFQCSVPEHSAEVSAPHVGHPGCFATAILLASVPLLTLGVRDDELFVNGITGSTGSGKSPQAGTHHPERHSNLYAYKALEHRHTPEILALAKAASGKAASVSFVPHSGPYARGIYATVQAKTAREMSEPEALQHFENFYADSPFVEVLGAAPKLKNVVASNHCQVSVSITGSNIVVMSAIDNLVKGAAGGAVQWMNRLWKLPETAGLLAASPAWT